MIGNDQELSATMERIRHLQTQVTHLRKAETNPANYHLSASGFSPRSTGCSSRCASTSPFIPVS